MDDVENKVKEDFTDDPTNDLARARHISHLIVNCCRINSAQNLMNDLAILVAFASFSHYLTFTVPDITGSCAELYIDSGLTCIGDIDLMYPVKEVMVICDGSVVDSIYVKETFEVCQIGTSDCPTGYVHLRVIGKHQFNWETEQFEYRFSNNTGVYYRIPHTHLFHGPALSPKRILLYFKNLDIVPCLRILAWPPVAQSWLSRDRNYSWPSTAIVSEVQRNGCDLVYVSHRDYKYDEFQWRYSFSRAEVTLIRSWTPIQQLVYHMLRYFAKRTIIRDSKDDDKVICTYHIKTLML